MGTSLVAQESMSWLSATPSSTFSWTDDTSTRRQRASGAVSDSGKLKTTVTESQTKFLYLIHFFQLDLTFLIVNHYYIIILLTERTFR